MAIYKRTIGNTEIEVEDLEMNQVELLFYKDNPRVFTQLHTSEDDDPSQEDIQKMMCKLDSVKTLKRSIEANGGLINPIYVCNNVVLEGNSRLAAYRLLAKQDPEKWAKIKCTRLPNDISEDLILTLLGTVHIVGQTPWSPFEKACYIHRTVNKSRLPISAIADKMCIKKKEAEDFFKVYQKMVEVDDITPSKWSYYLELLKSKPIAEIDSNNPTKNILDTIVSKIKNDEIEEAKDIRKFATIAKSKKEGAAQLFEDYFNDEITLDEAVEKATEINNQQRIKKDIKKFHELLKNEIFEVEEIIKADVDAKVWMNGIIKTIDELKSKI